jgi:hypothetical protein
LQITFVKAANGQATCTINGVHIHSSYNPSHEAAQFVDSISCSFNPKYILITGPALSYCAIPLRKRFPDAVLCAVQFISNFSAADHFLWNKVFNLQDSTVPLSEQIFSYMGDEGIVSCLFLSWQPSEKAFPEEYDDCWREIKKAVLKSRSVLTTRSFFARRWTRNAIRFCLFTSKTYLPLKGNAPIILCASGPSLTTSLPFIEKFQKLCTIMCVSSALAPLVSHNIYPDVCISTDGGYWAKRHLSFYLNKAPHCICALTSESASFASVLQNHPILPLKYDGGPGDTLLDACAFPTLPASRNGTVSGTAALLALHLTSAPVFFCGLDLSPCKGFAHTQPNELELSDSQFDNRFETKETRVAPATFASASLDIYQSWFNSTDFSDRLYRLSNKWQYQNKLTTVKDVDWNFFGVTLSNTAEKEKIYFAESKSAAPIEERDSIIKKCITDNILASSWTREAVPAESVIYERCKNTVNEATAAKAVERAMNSFFHDILRAFGTGSQT